MRQEAFEQTWVDGCNGDSFAQALIGIWSYEGRFIEKNLPYGLNILHELQSTKDWVKEILHYIHCNPDNNNICEGMKFSEHAIAQIKEASSNNKYALALLGVIKYKENKCSSAKEDGKRIIAKAVQCNCLWADDLLKEITDIENAPTDNFNYIFTLEKSFQKQELEYQAKVKKMPIYTIKQDGYVVVGKSTHIGKFHYLENFHINLERKNKYGVSLFECEKAIKEACQFFEIPVPSISNDLTDIPKGHTMFYSRNNNPKSFADDVLTYNMEQLKELGVNSMDAFSLVITHECAHRVLQNTTLPGLNNGRWEEELCCDFFMGVRCGIDKFSFLALDNVRKGLKDNPGAVTHPTGKLRYDVISYGITYVGYMDLIQKRRRSISEYLQIFETWRQKHAEEIRQAQIPFYG